MVDINKIRAGLSVEVEDNGFVIPGVIMVIDPEREVVGVKTVFSNDTRIFSPEKVYFRYPCHNGHRQEFSPPLLGEKTKELMGLIVSLAEGKVSPTALQKIADGFKKQGVQPVASWEI